MKDMMQQKRIRYLSFCRTGTATCRTGTCSDTWHCQGQALLEFTLTLPLLFLLIILTINLGDWLHAWIEIGNTARAAANYAIMGGASAGLPPSATGAQIVSLIMSDLSTLPNTSGTNPTISICQNDNGTITSLSGTCPTGTNVPPADPESTSYVSLTVDVTYTYTPLFNAFNFPTLGISLTPLPGTIHRRTVMRMLQ
jgi:Flp pilus assembly protein TadG